MATRVKCPLAPMAVFIFCFISQGWTNALRLSGRKAQRKLAPSADVSLSLSLSLLCFPCHLCEPAVVLGGKMGGPKPLTHFRGFVWLAQNSADIYILWWIVKNKRSSSALVDGAARMPEVLYLPWCLASLLPHCCSPPTPVSRWPGCCPQCTSTQPTVRGPLSMLWERPGQPKAPICVNGLTSAHAAQL